MSSSPWSTGSSRTATGSTPTCPSSGASSCRVGPRPPPGSTSRGRSAGAPSERPSEPAERHELGPLVAVYLNRLSDLLFILARAANARRRPRRAALEAGRDTGLTGRGGAAEVLGVALRLGLTSFGGPVAHIGYFRHEYVERRRWVDEQAFSELVAVTNLLPGPSSSQLGMAIGARRAGALGGLAAWVGFTLPSAAAMTALALVVGSADVSGAGWVHGLELVAVPVVALAGARRCAARSRRTSRGSRSRPSPRRSRSPGTASAGRRRRSSSAVSSGCSPSARRHGRRR